MLPLLKIAADKYPDPDDIILTERHLKEAIVILLDCNEIPQDKK